MKTKKIFATLLIVTMVAGLLSFAGITASAVGYIDSIYLKPNSITLDMANTSSGSYFEVTAHGEEGVISKRMTKVATGVYGVAIAQTVNHFEFMLKDAGGEPIWQALAIYEGEGNCVSFEVNPDEPVWMNHNGSGTTDGNSMIYFTPNEEWKNETSRFAVRINISGKIESKELIPVENDVYGFTPVDGAISYIFGALRPDASSPDEFLYTARGASKPSGTLNYYILNDGATASATGRWTTRQVSDIETPPDNPGQVVPDSDDEAVWGTNPDVPDQSGSLADALSRAQASTLYITLIKSIELTETIETSGGDFFVDLAGYTIETDAERPFFFENTTIRFRDTEAGGRIFARSVLDCYMFEVQNTTLIIQGGKYETANSGIITQTGTESHTIINGGDLFAGRTSVITIHEGNLTVDGGGFYGVCSDAHISYRNAAYNRNITINNIDTNDNTTLAIYNVQNPIPLNTIAAAGRLIVSDSPDGGSSGVLYPDRVYYINVNLYLSFTEGHPTVTVKKGNSYNMPQYSESYPPGMELVGWKDSETGEIYHVGMPITPTKDMTFSPEWAEGTIISVSFCANGGTGSMSTMESTAGSPFALPHCEFSPPEGKVFDKWQVNGEEYNKTEMVVLTEDTEVIALWKDGVRVIYKANGGIGDDVVTYVESGGKIILPKDIFTAPEGKTFRKWQVNGMEFDPGNTISIESETEILALWRDGFNVVYKANGGKGSTRTEEYSGETTIILPKNFYTAPTGKYFRCWEVNGKEHMPDEEITVNGETTILALWGDLHTVKYIFVVRPITGEEPYTKVREETAKDGQTYTIKHPIEVFAESFYDELEPYWWEDEDGKQYQIHETVTVEGDMTFTINYKWRYKVSINPDNDTDSTQNYEVPEGEYIVLPDAPQGGKIGYIFDGWRSVKSGSVYNPGDRLAATQNEGFVAQWKKCINHSFADGICVHCSVPEKGMIMGYSAETKTVSVVVSEEGTYTVIFASYGEEGLENTEYATITFTEDTKGTVGTVSITKDFSLSAGDKIMLWSGETTLMPLCKAYVLK